MKIDSLVLILDDAQWQLKAMGHETVLKEVTCDWPQSSDLDRTQQIQNLQTTLQNWGYAKQPVVMIVPDHWCLCATQAGKTQHKNRQNVLYDFEVNWPIALEDLVADYLSGRETALGVCTEQHRLKPVIEVITKLNLNLQAICPKAMLALQHHLATTTQNTANHTIWANGNAYHWFTLEDRKPVSWHWLSPSQEALVLQAQSLYLTEKKPLQIQLLDMPQNVQKELEKLPQITITQNDTAELQTAACSGAQRIASKKIKPWINFLRPPLVQNSQEQATQKSLSFLLSAIVMLGITFCGTLSWRSGLYQDIARKNKIQQQQIFKDLFPDSRIPPNVASRISSELRNMIKHTRVNPFDKTATDQTSALILFHQTMLSLPTTLPMHLQEIRLENNNIDLRGQAKQHAQVQSIANALRTNPNLQVNTPQMTQTQAGFIRYTITASYSKPLVKGENHEQ